MAFSVLTPFPSPAIPVQLYSQPFTLKIICFEYCFVFVLEPFASWVMLNLAILESLILINFSLCSFLDYQTVLDSISSEFMTFNFNLVLFKKIPLCFYVRHLFKSFSVPSKFYSSFISLSSVCTEASFSQKLNTFIPSPYQLCNQKPGTQIN